MFKKSVWLLANELVVAENSPHPAHIQLRMHVYRSVVISVNPSIGVTENWTAHGPL